MNIFLKSIQHPINSKYDLVVEQWELQEGQSSLISGSNHSGASCLASILANRLKPKKGDIYISNPDRIAISSNAIENEILEEDRYNNDSEFMDGGFDPGRTAQEIIGSGLNQLKEVIDILGVEPLLDKSFKLLSSGETQKVLIAKALSENPELLILEEPFRGLDIQSRPAFFKTIRDLIQNGIQVILIQSNIEHAPDEISQLLYLESGEVLWSGSRDKFLQSEKWESLSHTNYQLPHYLPDCYNYDSLDSSIPLIEVKNMNLSYNDKPVFKELNWIFKRGEHWRIAGPNGSGKSSLLGMISGDNPKAYGKDITLFGVKRGSGESIWDIKRYFGIVSNALHRDHRAPGNTLDVVLSGFYDSIGLHDKATPSQIKIGVEWLSLLGMEGHRKTSFTQLSFGEQRSVLIARAMVKLPMILLLDEPLTGLDENHRNQVLALIDYIADNSQTHILFVSHDQRNDLSCINKNLEFFKSGDHYKIRINS